MSEKMAETLLEDPTLLSATIEEKRKAKLRRIAILECVLGSVLVILCIIRDVDVLGPYLVLQALPGIVVVVCGSLPLFCKNNPTSSSYDKCLLRGHLYLARTGFLSLSLFISYELSQIMISCIYHGYIGDPLRYYPITIILLLLAIIIALLLLFWSFAISKKLLSLYTYHVAIRNRYGKMLCLCLRENESDTDYRRTQRSTLYFRKTPEKSQLITIQPYAREIQSHFNGTVPSKVVIMEPACQQLRALCFNDVYMELSELIKNKSNTNYQPQQVVCLQPRTPKNPKLTMKQPCAPNMQPIQPNFNGVQPIQLNFNGVQPIQPYFNGVQPIQLNFNGVQPIQLNFNAVQPIQLNFNGVRPIQPYFNGVQPIQLNFNGVQPIQLNFNAVQPIQPYFNGTVPPTALIMQPRIQPSQIQPTLSPNQGINIQESSPEVVDVAPEVKPETNDVSNISDVDDEENQLLIPE